MQPIIAIISTGRRGVFREQAPQVAELICIKAGEFGVGAGDFLFSLEIESSSIKLFPPVNLQTTRLRPWPKQNSQRSVFWDVVSTGVSFSIEGCPRSIAGLTSVQETWEAQSSTVCSMALKKNPSSPNSSHACAIRAQRKSSLHAFPSILIN